MAMAMALAMAMANLSDLERDKCPIIFQQPLRGLVTALRL